jgi:hypothetical protein
MLCLGAMHLRQQFYTKVDRPSSTWFDAVPPDAYEDSSWPRKPTIDPVMMQHANGVYRDPEWSNGDHLPQDWIDFVAGVIERSRKVREHIEAAPHQLENA